jgi:tetratricopeptide (TPR) repeat protein
MAWALLPDPAMPVGAISEGSRPGHEPARATAVLWAALIVVALALVYEPVRHAAFFYFDDDFYVTDNPFVRHGLTLAGLAQAFLGSRGALWMPLAFTSHMIDVSLFGLTAGGPHVVNVVLHAATTLLLLAFLVRTTGAVAPSVTIAALFALHPMRVESVAWIAERKDVLSAFFGLVTLHAWVSFTRAPTPGRYRLVMLATGLALLSKPMLVTLPLLLLCIDVWPLGRLGAVGDDGRARTARDLVVEKVPLAILAAAGVVLTLLAAHGDGALVSLADRPASTRLAHAVASYVWYAWKTVWPDDLAVLYPYPAWSFGQIVASAVAVSAAAALTVAARRTAPWITAGLAWFAIALLPALGLLQAGDQGMADRFTYVPTIGLLVAVVWTLHVAAHTRELRAALAGAVVVIVGAWGIASHRYADLWRRSELVLAHAYAVTRNNWRVEQALGSLYANAGQHAAAYEHFDTALRIEPRSPTARYGLGLALDGLGRPDEAAASYREAIRMHPDYWRPHHRLAAYLLAHGDLSGALHHFGEAVRLKPAPADVAKDLRNALELAGFPKPNAEGYVKGLLVWGHAIASDQGTRRGAAYGTQLASELLDASAARLHACVDKGGDGAHAPFSLYVQVDANGALPAVTAMPPTAVARCLRDELRTARAPTPPFAPFHAQVAIGAHEAS